MFTWQYEREKSYSQNNSEEKEARTKINNRPRKENSTDKEGAQTARNKRKFVLQCLLGSSPDLFFNSNSVDNFGYPDCLHHH